MPLLRYSTPLFFTILLLLLAAGAAAQNDAPPPRPPVTDDELPDVTEQLIEDILQNDEESSGGEFAFNGAFDILRAYQKNPLDLNKATEEDLIDLLLLNDVQIAEFLTYRTDMGGSLLNFYELQAVPGFDVPTIRRIQPFVRVGGGLDDLSISPRRMIAEGERELFVRWTRTLEEQRGYTADPDQTNSFYFGDPNQIYVRFRQRYSNKMSFGITAEKDAGEAFFREPNKKGFDYYSAHFFLRDVTRTLRAVALGDYSINMGQGLVLNSGFGYGKSALAVAVKRGGRTVRPYSSVNEVNFMRGAAATLGFGQHLELTVFGSRKGRDANLVELDTTEVGEALIAVSSLDIDGFHRTPAEVEDRNAVTQTSVGGVLKYQRGRGDVALNVLNENLSQPLQLRDQPYNRFFFQGTNLLNVSLDYSYRLGNVSLFGETAWSDNNALATVNGLLVGLDRNIDLAVVYRNYAKDYQALLARPFAETAGGRNESGFYIGTEMRPLAHWKISAYYDIWRHPWLRFNADAPSNGHEYRLRLTYWQKRKLEAYLDVRNEVKDLNNPSSAADIPPFTSGRQVLIERSRFQARLHFAYIINKTLEWRSRFDWGYTRLEFLPTQTGFMIQQDLLYRPAGPFSMNGRLAFFDTDGFDVRFYQFENGLLYNFRVPAFFGRGSRMYLNLRYKGIRNLTLEARIAQTYFADGRTAGSGLNATDKPHQTEVGAQVKVSF